MTEWDKLWIPPYAYIEKDGTIGSTDASLDEIKAVGDKLHEKAQKWERLQDSPLLAHDDPNHIIGQAELDFKIMKRLREEIKQLRESNKTWEIAWKNTLAERDGFLKKLEAIRGAMRKHGDNPDIPEDFWNELVEALGE